MKKRFLPVFLGLLSVPAVLAAQTTLAITYSILSTRNEGRFARAVIRVEAFNLGQEPLTNVDLRLEEHRPNSVERRVLQLGKIPQGEARIAIGDLFLERALIAPGRSLLWRVDYEDARRNHEQRVVRGIRRD